MHNNPWITYASTANKSELRFKLIVKIGPRDNSLIIEAPLLMTVCVPVFLIVLVFSIWNNIAAITRRVINFNFENLIVEWYALVWNEEFKESHKESVERLFLSCNRSSYSTFLFLLFLSFVVSTTNIVACCNYKWKDESWRCKEKWDEFSFYFE